MDTRLLSALGLGDKEIKLYTAVVKAKELAPAELAKAIGIKRTTAYSMARNLVEKGLLLEDATRRPRVFTPASPDDLQTEIQAEKKRSEHKQELLTKLAEEVSQVQAETIYPVPRIRFVGEDKLEAFLHQAMPEWDKSMLETDPTWWGFQDHTYIDYFMPYLDWYWKQAPEGIDLKLLTNRSSTEAALSGKHERRHVKFWGEATNFTSTTWVVGDYVVMVNTRQKPFYLVEIHDKLMAHDQREVFRNLWEMV
jgi:predicted transcriptional regulator